MYSQEKFMKCDNCNAYNAHVIKLSFGDELERHVLCPRCLKILKTLNEDFENTMLKADNQYQS